MGYAPQYFEAHVGHWIKSGWLPDNGAVADLGSQEFNESTKLVGDEYRSRGFYYQAFDIDGRFGSTYMDLNTAQVSGELLSRFDVVNNEGTIEHLANPINGFKVCHDLCKTGGVIRHSMPVSGWQHHGLFHPTPLFYRLLAEANGYEILSGSIEINAFHRNQGADCLPNRRSLCRILRMLPGEFWGLDKWGHICYRKTTDSGFKIPMDHVAS